MNEGLQGDVVARYWDGGWELRIDDCGVGTSRTLAGVELAAREHLASKYGIDIADVAVTVHPDLGEAHAREVRNMQRAQRDAEAAEYRARTLKRIAVRKLHRNGVGIADVARMLEVSEEEARQLLTGR